MRIYVKLMRVDACIYFADSSHINAGNMKLILALIWALILHYSIALARWNDEDDLEQSKGGRERFEHTPLLAGAFAEKADSCSHFFFIFHLYSSKITTNCPLIFSTISTNFSRF